MHLDRTSRRILGCLIEKRYSTPEQYPLTLNALVLACNQRSNREPEMELDDFIVEGCLKQLRIDQWIMVVEREAGRSVRYAERMVEQLGLSKDEAAVLAELMLRGPQTEQELHRRCERMARMATFDTVLGVLGGLADRGLVEHMPREIGQRVARWRHLLTPPDEEDATTTETGSSASSTPAAPAPEVPPTPAPRPAAVQVPAPAPVPAPASAPAPVPSPDARVADLRAEVDALRAEVATLQRRVERLERPRY